MPWVLDNCLRLPNPTNLAVSLRIESSHGTIKLNMSGGWTLSFASLPMPTEKTITLTPTSVTSSDTTSDATSANTSPVTPATPVKRHSRAQMALALGVAAVSDVLSWVALVPPFDWVLDAVTAFALFMIFGKRWALLPGLAAEAIPGMGVFPVWVLVVLSILAYDGIKKPLKL